MQKKIWNEKMAKFPAPPYDCLIATCEEMFLLTYMCRN